MEGRQRERGREGIPDPVLFVVSGHAGALCQENWACLTHLEELPFKLEESRA